MDHRVEAGEIKAALSQLVDTGLFYSVNFITAVLILVAGYLISGWIARTIRQRLTRVERFDRTLIPIIAQIARYSILVFTGIVVLAKFGIQTTSIIAVLGAAGLAIGLALQGTLQNVAAGLMLLILRPFQVGDYVEAANTGGTVDEIGLFMTRMHTPQGVFVAVPNGKIWADTITNYSKLPRRRIDYTIGIAYEDDVDKAVEILRQLVRKEERILADPEPRVLVRALGESSVDLQIRAWTDRQDFWDVQFQLTRDLKYALDAAGISIPYPHRQIVVTQAPTAPSDGQSGVPSLERPTAQ